MATIRERRERILSAYYLVDQLIRTKRFDPNDAVRKGKGSQAEFPFSLIYNAIGFSNIKRWIDLPEGRRALRPDPISGDLENAEWLMHFICGSQRLDFAPVIKESRDLKLLANALSSPVWANALKRGATLSQVAQEALPDQERVEGGLVEARELLEGTLGVVGRGSLTARQATQLLPLSREIIALTNEIAENPARLSIGNAPKRRSKRGDVWLSRIADFETAINADETEFNAVRFGETNLEEGLRDEKQAGGYRGIAS